MPKLDAKMIQKELDQGKERPLYWLVGSEHLKKRELMKRIQSKVGVSPVIFDQDSTDLAGFVDELMTPNLFGGRQLLVLRGAEKYKDVQPLLNWAKDIASSGDLAGPVCVVMSESLDGRKKSTKAIIEAAAVIECAEVLESERAAWIDYLAKRMQIKISSEVHASLLLMDPWTLGIIEQELMKIQEADLDETGTAESQNAALDGIAGTSALQKNELFLGSFFNKDLTKALGFAKQIAEGASESLPLLGLLGWNLRHLFERVRLGPYKAQTPGFLKAQIEGWAKRWTVSELSELERELESIDFAMKQTKLEPLGLWCGMVTRFCSKGA